MPLARAVFGRWLEHVVGVPRQRPLIARASDQGRRDLERRIDALYEAPLEEFTALRNELAKELRRSGERDAAEEVGRLRKPTRRGVGDQPALTGETSRR